MEIERSNPFSCVFSLLSTPRRVANGVSVAIIKRYLAYTSSIWKYYEWLKGKLEGRDVIRHISSVLGAL